MFTASNWGCSAVVLWQTNELYSMWTAASRYNPVDMCIPRGSSPGLLLSKKEVNVAKLKKQLQEYISVLYIAAKKKLHHFYFNNKDIIITKDMSKHWWISAAMYWSLNENTKLCRFLYSNLEKRQRLQYFLFLWWDVLALIVVDTLFIPKEIQVVQT